MVSIELLNKSTPNSIIQVGEVYCDNLKKIVTWVAVRGGIPDWAIYKENEYTQERSNLEKLSKTDYLNLISDSGTKLRDLNQVQRLTSSDKETMDWYRD